MSRKSEVSITAECELMDEMGESASLIPIEQNHTIKFPGCQFCGLDSEILEILKAREENGD